MAPRKRSSRADKLATQRLLENGKAPNNSGLAGLPDELFLEVLTHMPSYPLPKLNWIDAAYDPDRQLTLISLSQTCQSLRGFFLHHAWGRIEVQFGQKVARGCLATYARYRKARITRQDHYDKLCFDEVTRQFETVTIRNPSLAKYVQ